MENNRGNIYLIEEDYDLLMKNNFPQLIISSKSLFDPEKLEQDIVETIENWDNPLVRYFNTKSKNIFKRIRKEGLRVLNSEPIIVECPGNLTGCIFSQSQELPDDYERVLSFWSGRPDFSTNSAHYQNPKQEYFIELSDDDYTPVESNEYLLSEGIVVHAKLPMVGTDEWGGFLHFKVPIKKEYVSSSQSMYNTWKEENQDERNNLIFEGKDIRYLDFYLSVEDICFSPKSSEIYIDLIQYEEINEGYVY